MESSRPRRSRQEHLPGVWTGEHLPGLDGLRGLAVVGVIAFHDGRLRGGWLGVDLFFTLSGFLIASLALAEVHRSGRVDLAAFWRRRARRLLPALLLLVGVLVAWSHLTNDGPWVTTDLRGASAATLAYVANWYQAFATTGYWSQYAVASPLQHTWSLAIEEQFYLLFPLLIWWIARRSSRPARLLLVAATAGIAASVAALVILGHTGASVNRIYLGTDTRAASILVGVVLAAVLARRASPTVGADDARSAAPDVLAVLAVTGLALLWWRTGGQGSFVADGGLLLHAALVVVLISVVVRRPEARVARGLGWAPLAHLGAVSYGLYLWHWPVFLYVDERFVLAPAVATALKVAVSLALAEVSLALVERPARRQGAALLGGRVPTASVGGLLVLAVALLPPAQPLGGVDNVLARAPKSLDDLGTAVAPGPQTETKPAGAPSGPWSGRDLPALVGTGKRSTEQPVLDRPGRLPGPLRVAVVGDSVAFILGDQLVKDQTDLGIAVANRALPACSIGAPDQSRASGGLLPPASDCSGLWTEDAASFDPDIVVLSVNGDVGVEHRYDGRWGTTCAKGYQQAASLRLNDRLTAFSDRGARVFLLTPLINGRASVRLGSTPENVKCLERLELDIARRTPRMDVIDLGEWICPDPRADCRSSIDGVSVFRVDRMHFLGAPAHNVWMALLPTMLEQAGVPEQP